MTWPRSEAFWVGLLLLITATLYLPIRRAGFVYDDRGYVEQNTGIRHFNPRAIFTDPRCAATPESGLAADAYRPMVTLSFALDYYFWKLNPAGFHLENLLLGLTNAFMVWLFLRRVLPNPAARLLALAVFLWHPVQVQSIAWISQRGTLLSSAGMLIALLALAPPGPWPRLRLLIGWLAFGVALFCRETTGGVILALALLDGLHVCREGDPGVPTSRSRFWARYVGLALLTGGYIAIRSHLLPSWSEFKGHRNWRSDAALGLMAFAFYLGKLFWPTHLRLHYAYPEPTAWLISGAVFVALLFAAVFLGSWSRRPRLAAGLGWIVIFLIPVLQFIPVRAFAAERYLYFSLIGFVWIIGLAYIRYPKTRIPLSLAAVLFGIASARLIPAWHSEETLWAWSLRQAPHDAFAHVAYATCTNDPVLAEAHFRQALMENPPESIRVSALVNLSWLALQRKQFQNAEAWADQALKIDPDERHALFDLWRAKEGSGDRAGAQRARRRLADVSGNQNL